MGGNPVTKGCFYKDDDVYVVVAMAQASLLQITILPSDICVNVFLFLIHS